MDSSNSQIRVAGTGSFLPPTRVTNASLYEIDSIREAFDVERARGSLRGVEDSAALDSVDVFDAWVRQVTGIEERRWVTGADFTTENMAFEASRHALDHAGIEATDLDLILMSSVTPSEDVPNMAGTLGADLGAPKVGGYGLNAACSGFVHGLASARAFMASGAARNVLVASADSLTRITNFSDPTTAVLFADGAGAVVLSTEIGSGRIVGIPYINADYSPDSLNLGGQGWIEPGVRNDTLSMGGGPNVLRNAIQSMSEVARNALDSAALSWDDVDLVVPHQANLRITQGLERSLRLEKGRVIHNIQRLGNFSAATVAVTLDELVRGKHGPVPDPATIVLTAVGGGYASGAVVMEWDGGSVA